ncbi:branched-chain amino acid ABC transporter substrate-binding protein [Massilia sp. TS11]|uniref:branched-chain amino acid ABC transporter substrate-binding protein n=1 Tax=Massilia sp. TS11 TaxID=2908003 RepID=UPI001EDA56F0|nr:branched-chain amino acid ABC transporter substrate-binding protein [Massilia sp. TS11]MCG2583799.1 branched-chain amino acid ABC transporter substrate-binding protein [Massilia sp. TS11]
MKSLLPLLLLGALTPALADDVVKIGHVAPTSGPSSHFGKDNENAARMAVEELNAKGFTLGGKKVKLVLLTEDDGGDPKQGTAVAQKLVDAKVNGVIGHLNSGVTIPASKIYHDAGIPQISGSSSAAQYTRQGFKTAFRVIANDARLGGTLGKYAATTAGYKRIAVIDDRTAYGQGLADEFVKGAKANGVEIVAREFTSDKASDFTAILTKIRSKKPDAIFFGGMDAVGGPMLKQVQSLGLQSAFLGGDGLCSENLAQLAGGKLPAAGVLCIEAGGVKGEQEPKIAAYRARYVARYKIPVQVYGPQIYDAVMVMAAAMQKAQSADPAKYLPALASIQYEGITGRIAFDANGDLKDGAMTLFTYKDGKKTRVDVLR